MMDKIRKAIQQGGYGDWAGALFLLAAVGMLLYAARLCFCDGIWYDELYTMGLAENSFRRLTALTAMDVHPPFYYYYVKTVQGLCRMAAPGLSAVAVGKLCSVLPLAGLFVYGITKVRRHFGLLCAGLFAFCIVSMPSLPQYTVEIRMYTLTMFLVTAAFLHGFEIVCGVSGERKRGAIPVDWLCLAVYGILAAYTHYFACVAVAVIYVSLFVFFICAGRKGDGCPWKEWLAAVIVSALAYLPWMAVVARQVAQVKENYWILPLTWRIFGSCVKFLMKPQFGSGGFQVAAAVVLFAVYGGLFFYILWKYRKERQICFACMAGTGVLAGVVLFGCAASFLLRPVFITRYMLPASGCFWLSFALFVSLSVKGKKAFLPLLGLVFLLGVGDFRWFRNDETWRRVKMEEVEEGLALIGPEDIVLTQFNQVQGVVGYYLENKVYLWDSQPEELLCRILEDKYGTMDKKGLERCLEDGAKVWFIGNRNSDLLKEWEQAGIHMREHPEFMLEIYWVSPYELTLEESGAAAYDG